MKLRKLFYEQLINANKGDIIVYNTYDKTINTFTKNDFEAVTKIIVSKPDFTKETIKVKQESNELNDKQAILLEIMLEVPTDPKKYSFLPNNIDVTEHDFIKAFWKITRLIDDSSPVNNKRINIEKCLKYFKEINQYDNYLKFKEYTYYDFIDKFIEKNNLIIKPLNKSNFTKLVSLAMEIYALEPWKYFSDQDIIKINYNNLCELYYTVLGASGECFGLVIRSSNDCENPLNDLYIENTIVMEDSNNLLPGFISNKHTIYYDKLIEMFDEDAALNIKKYIDDADDNKIYPSFNEYIIGKFPKQISNKNEINVYENAIKAFKQFILSYQSKNIIHPDYDAIIEVTILKRQTYFEIKEPKNQNVLYKKNIFPKREIEETTSTIKYTNDIGYFNIHAFPFQDENNNAVLMPILYNDSTQNIIPFEPFVVLNNDVISTAAATILNALKNQEIPKKIYVCNTYCYCILKDIFKDAIVIEMNHDKDITADIFDDIASKIFEKNFVN